MLTLALTAAWLAMATCANAQPMPAMHRCYALLAARDRDAGMDCATDLALYNRSTANRPFS